MHLPSRLVGLQTGRVQCDAWTDMRAQLPRSSLASEFWKLNLVGPCRGVKTAPPGRSNWEKSLAGLYKAIAFSQYAFLISQR